MKLGTRRRQAGRQAGIKEGEGEQRQMALFERASSYSTLMVTMALYASVSKLQTSEICLTSI